MASGDDPKTIILKGDPIAGEKAARASSNIKPGMLIERDSDGTVRPNSTAGGVNPGGTAAKMFAKEADYVGDGIDDVYEDGENVPFYMARQGDWIYAFVAYGEDIAIGDMLQSDGAGALEALESDGYAVAVAVEAVNNTLGGAAARIKVEVL